MSLCDYKYALGKPNTGIHTHIGGFAVADVAMTIGLAYAATYAGFSFVRVLILLLVIATALHYIFCVPTAGAVALGLVNSTTPIVS